MATFSTSCTFTEITPNCGIKEIVLESPAAGIHNSTLAITLSDYGITATGLSTVQGYDISSVYGVIVTDAPTTAVASGVLTVTSGTEAGTKVYRITGQGN